MASGNSGSFIIGGTKQMSAVCYWSETYDVASNTHVVSIDRVMLKSTNWYGFTYYIDGSVQVNGSAVINFSSAQGTHNCYIGSQNTEYQIYAGSGYANSPWVSGSISGSADGTCTVTITLSFYGYTYNGSGASGFCINGSSDVALYTIPRKSSVSGGSGEMASATTITITRAASSFTHTLVYAFGNASGTIATQTSSVSVSWTPPVSLASQIPNGVSGTGTITCHTYSGDTLVGSSSCAMTLTVPASVKPTLTSLTATRVDGTVPSGWGVYVQTKSKATLTINGAAGSYGSSVTAYSITGGGYTGTAASLTTGFLNTAGTITFTAKVMDSRGRWSSEKTVSITVHSYSLPSVSSCSVQRCGSGGAVQDDGTYALGNVAFSYSSCGGHNTVTTATFYKQTSAASYTDAGKSFTSGTAFVFGGGNLSIESSYDVKFRLTDAFGTVDVNLTLSTASVLMDFKAGGKGLGIGKIAEYDNTLDVAFAARFFGNLNCAGQISNSMNSVMVGSREAQATTIPTIIEVVRHSNGMIGSLSLGEAYGNMPTGWYNYMWIPHRAGGDGGDNNLYGTLITTPMTSDYGTLYIIHYIGGTIYSPWKFTGSR